MKYLQESSTQSIAQYLVFSHTNRAGVQHGSNTTQAGSRGVHTPPYRIGIIDVNLGCDQKPMEPDCVKVAVLLYAVSV